MKVNERRTVVGGWLATVSLQPWREIDAHGWKISAPHINLSLVLSVCQKLSKLVEFWRRSGKNNFAQFFGTRCILSATKMYRRGTLLVVLICYLFMAIILRSGCFW